MRVVVVEQIPCDSIDERRPERIEPLFAAEQSDPVSLKIPVTSWRTRVGLGPDSGGALASSLRPIMGGGPMSGGTRPEATERARGDGLRTGLRRLAANSASLAFE